MDSIWPQLRGEDIELHLAGRKMPSYLMDLHGGNLHIHGEVESATDFMHAHDIMIVPLLSGSGIRIKIIEAMACGKAVITTKVGAEGIAYTNNKDIIIATSAEEFKQAIIDLSQNPDKVVEIGKNARALIEKHYNNADIIQELINFYQN